MLVCVLIAKSICNAPDLAVTPEGVAGITAESSQDNLAELFGSGNIETTREHLGEGYYSEGAVVYGGTENELAVVWEDGFISQIRIQGPGLKTPEGIGLGSSLTDLEEVIGEFEMAGFAWDAEGYVNLEGTIYEGLYMRLTPEVGVPERFLGDSMFSSGELREYNPVLTDLRVMFP